MSKFLRLLAVRRIGEMARKIEILDFIGNLDAFALGLHLFDKSNLPYIITLHNSV